MKRAGAVLLLLSACRPGESAIDLTIGAEGRVNGIYSFRIDVVQGQQQAVPLELVPVEIPQNLPPSTSVELRFDRERRGAVQLTVLAFGRGGELLARDTDTVALEPGQAVASLVVLRGVPLPTDGGLDVSAPPDLSVDRPTLDEQAPPDTAVPPDLAPAPDETVLPDESTAQDLVSPDQVPPPDIVTPPPDLVACLPGGYVGCAKSSLSCCSPIFCNIPSISDPGTCCNGKGAPCMSTMECCSGLRCLPQTGKCG